MSQPVDAFLLVLLSASRLIILSFLLYSFKIRHSIKTILYTIGIFASFFTAQPSSLYGNPAGKEHATFGATGHATFQNKRRNFLQTLVFSGLDGFSAAQHPERGRKQDALGGGEKIGAAQSKAK